MASEINWSDYQPSHQHRQIIKHGTTHSLFSSAALAVILRAAEAEARGNIPHHVKSQMTSWISNAVSMIDDRAFNSRIQSYEEYIDDRLNAIAVAALERFGL